MKRKILVLLVMLMSFGATKVMAQEPGDIAVGGNLAFSSGQNITNNGLGVKFQWNPAYYFRVESSLTYFFRSENVRIVDFGVNLHYQVELADEVFVYPLAGVSVIGCNGKYEDLAWGRRTITDTEFGVNLGGGIDYEISENYIVNAELKYKIAGYFDRFILSVGMAYKF